MSTSAVSNRTKGFFKGASIVVTCLFLVWAIPALMSKMIPAQTNTVSENQRDSISSAQSTLTFDAPAKWNQIATGQPSARLYEAHGNELYISVIDNPDTSSTPDGNAAGGTTDPQSGKPNAMANTQSGPAPASDSGISESIAQRRLRDLETSGYAGEENFSAIESPSGFSGKQCSITKKNSDEHGQCAIVSPHADAAGTHSSTPRPIVTVVLTRSGTADQDGIAAISIDSIVRSLARANS